MPKYLKIAPDPDARVCHCGDGNPDCDHWESCDGCGMDYRKHEGHDCIDGVPVQDLRPLAKELRDSLDACETERDRLRAQLAALQSVQQGVEVPELTDAFLDLACGPDLSGKADLHSAAFRDLSRLQYRRGWEDLAARLVPTPIKPIQPEERRVGPDEVVPWISVDDRLPEDGQSVAFVTKCNRDPFYHGRVLGGRYSDGEFGGFSAPGFMSDASHWLALPPAPDALRTSAQAHNGEESK